MLAAQRNLVGWSKEGLPYPRYWQTRVRLLSMDLISPRLPCTNRGTIAP